jgi:hypothetical protein
VCFYNFFQATLAWRGLKTTRGETTVKFPAKFMRFVNFANEVVEFQLQLVNDSCSVSGEIFLSSLTTFCQFGCFRCFDLFVGYNQNSRNFPKLLILFHFWRKSLDY